MSADKPIFVLLAELAEKDGKTPLNGSVWERELEDGWRFALNGDRQPQPSSDGYTVPGFTALLWFNGWPAGEITPHGGIIAAGAVANEQSFCAAIERAIAA